MDDPTLKLVKKLIARPSVTPEDSGCQKIIAEELLSHGFTVENMRFEDVDNLWLRRGTAKPLFVFAGHSDVVPPGPLDQWRFHPFTPTIEDGYLYGRGAADMKSSLAAFVTATKNFVCDHPEHIGSIALLVTSDEEGPAINGTVKVIDALSRRGDHIDYCIVGEPTSEEHLGDVVKTGRRGSLSARLQVVGTQGHVAYPQLAANPIHLVAPALLKLSTTTWDHGNEHFPPTSFQVINLNAGVGVSNVIPGELTLEFNFRFTTEITVDEIKRQVLLILDTYDLMYEIHWTLSAQPFLSAAGKLLDAVRLAVQNECAVNPRLETTGGTSDGRFIASTGTELVELGPSNRTIHQINEHIEVNDLRCLSKVYYGVLSTMLL